MLAFEADGVKGGDTLKSRDFSLFSLKIAEKT